MMKKQPSRAYLFDVDGVLTNPEAKRVEQEAIFDELVKRLLNGYPVGLNTGRALEFVIEEVLKPLEKKLNNNSAIENLFAIGEKGATWITYNQKGEKNAVIDNSISVPLVIQHEVREMVSKPPYSEVMFYDETKKTMVTTELLQGKTIAAFEGPQKKLTEALQRLLQKHHLVDTLKIDAGHIATDIENKHVGKNLGAKRFITLLEERQLYPEEYIGFGDSASDYDMYDELKKIGKKALFVFVGGEKYLQGKSLEGVIFTHEHDDKGTLAFLQQEELNS